MRKLILVEILGGVIAWSELVGGVLFFLLDVLFEGVSDWTNQGLLVAFLVEHRFFE